MATSPPSIARDTPPTWDEELALAETDESSDDDDEEQRIARPTTWVGGGARTASPLITTTSPTNNNSNSNSSATTATTTTISTPPPPPSSAKIWIDEMRFVPADLTVRVGTTVAWSQLESCASRNFLEIVDDDEAPVAASPPLAAGESWSWTFDACGSYHFRSLVYVFMKGSVTVVDADVAGDVATTGGADGNKEDAGIVVADAYDFDASPEAAAAARLEKRAENRERRVRAAEEEKARATRAAEGMMREIESRAQAEAATLFSSDDDDDDDNDGNGGTNGTPYAALASSDDEEAEEAAAMNTTTTETTEIEIETEVETKWRLEVEEREASRPVTVSQLLERTNERRLSATLSETSSGRGSGANLPETAGLSPLSSTFSSSSIPVPTHPTPTARCDKCKRAFASTTNLARHRQSHRFDGKSGRHGKPFVPPATREQLAACWRNLCAETRREVLDLGVGGEAGVLVLTAFASRGPGSFALVSSGVNNKDLNGDVPADGGSGDVRARYAAAGDVLRTYVDGDVNVAKTVDADAFLTALHDASEGGFLGPKCAVDLSSMVSERNLEAALALLLEERLMRAYVKERGAEAERTQRLLMAELDEAAADKERREAQKMKMKAKKAKQKSRKRAGAGAGAGAGATETGGKSTAHDSDGDDDRGGDGDGGGGVDDDVDEDARREEEKRRAEAEERAAASEREHRRNEAAAAAGASTGTPPLVSATRAIDP